jgi:hypothetical protein
MKGECDKRIEQTLVAIQVSEFFLRIFAYTINKLVK